MRLPRLLSGLLKRSTAPTCVGDCTLDMLPYDVSIYMMTFLPISQISTMSQVSKHFNSVCESDALWEWFCELKWREITRSQSSESRTAGPDAAQIQNETFIDSHAKKFVDSLRKGFNGSYRDMYMTLVTLPLTDSSVSGEGLFHWLGCYDEHSTYTPGRPFSAPKLLHVNPAEISQERVHKVRVVASSQKTGKNGDWISRKNTACWTENQAGEWFRVDLGRNLTFAPTHYQMRYGSKGGKVLPKSWVMQGSNDCNKWTDLRVHENDTTFTKADYCLGTWNVDSHFGESFRYFRVMLTDKTYSSHVDWDCTLVATGFELFGFAIAPPQFHSDMRTNRASKISDLVYAISYQGELAQITRKIEDAELDVNQVITPFGETLAHIAAQYNHESCLRWLVEKMNAQIDMELDSGESVFYVTTSTRVKDYLYKVNDQRLKTALKEAQEDRPVRRMRGQEF